MSQTYGMLYVADGSTAQAITSTPAKMTGFATKGPSDDAVSGNLSIVPTVASDKITVQPGVYRVDFQASFYLNAPAEVQAVLRGASAELAQGQCRSHSSGDSSDYDNDASMSFCCFVAVTVATDLEIYLEADASVNFTPVFAQLCVTKVG